MASPPSSSNTSSDPAAPPPTSSWVILGSIPRVVHGGGDKVPDVSLSLTAPPRVSLLNVSHRVVPRRPTPHNFPFVLAADSSGLLLLSVILGFPRSLADYADRPDVLCSRWRENDARLFVLDAATGSTLRLPNPEPKKPFEHQALVGILARPGGGFMVAELAPVVGSDEADLRCYSSELGEWVTKAVHYPLPARPLAPICTISHQGRLWWADYSWGIINADPCSDDPVLGFVPLPPGCVLERWEDWGWGWGRGRDRSFELDKFRYVGVSAGNLRFVCLDSIKWSTANKITVWTLPDANSIEWTMEHEATFADIWADGTYKGATGLSEKIPVLALIHPYNPTVVYFFLEGHLFGVDIPARKVVECDRYHLVAPPHDYGGASRFVRAWELPPAVSSGLGNWSSDISSEPNEAPPSGRSMPGDYRLMGNTRMSRMTFLV